jgi:hypothetical protein
MATMKTSYQEREMFRVVHPLDDEPEIKRSTEDLEPLQMTRSVKVSLLALRAYLIAMTLMLAYQALDLAGLRRWLH